MTAGRKPYPWTDAELAELGTAAERSAHPRPVDPGGPPARVRGNPAPPSSPLPEDPLLTAGELAELLQVSGVHVRRHAAALGGVHLPGRGDRPGPLRFHWPTVVRNLAEQQRQQASVGVGSQRSRRPQTAADAGIAASRPVPRSGTRVRLLPVEGSGR